MPEIDVYRIRRWCEHSSAFQARHNELGPAAPRSPSTTHDLIELAGMPNAEYLASSDENGALTFDVCDTVDVEFTNRHATLLRCRPLWSKSTHDSRVPLARLRYTQTTGLWTLYRPDKSRNFHLYKDVPGTPTVQNLLDFLSSPDADEFWVFV